MGYDSYASSYSSNHTIETYELLGQVGGGVFGDGGSSIQEKLCDSEFPYPDETYKPTAVKRSAPTSGGSANSQMEIEIPISCLAASWYLKQTPSYNVTVTIKSYQIEDGESVVVWIGTVRGASISDDTVTLQCEPITVSVKRAGLRRRWQYACPHVCYGDDCKLDINNFKFVANLVSSNGGNWYTVAYDGNQSSARVANAEWRNLIGGFMTYTSDMYSSYPTMMANILDAKIDSGLLKIQLDSPIAGLAVGGEMLLVPGCTHALTYCRDVMGNVLNFGGTPWIPLENPLGANQFA